MRRAPRSAPGGKGWRGTIGPRSASVPAAVRAISATACALACRAAPWPRCRKRGRQAVGVAARADQPDLAEHRHVDQRGARCCQAGLPRSRSGARQTASTSSVAASTVRLPQVASPSGPADDRAATLARAHCARTRPARRDDAAPACRRSAATAPRRARAPRTSRAQPPSNARVLLDAAFEQRRKPAGDQLRMAARDRNEPSAVTSKVTSATWSAGLPWRSIRGGSIALVKMSSIGTTPSGRSSPKPQTKRIVKVSVAMCIARSPCTCRRCAGSDDQRVAPTRAERRGGIGVPPQQRQRRRDQAGAQHAEQRDHALDRVGKLDADDGVGRQAEARSRAASAEIARSALRIGEPARRRRR